MLSSIRPLKLARDMMHVAKAAQGSGKASLAAKMPGEVLGPGVRNLDFRRGKALGRYQRGSERNLYVEFTSDLPVREFCSVSQQLQGPCQDAPIASLFADLALAARPALSQKSIARSTSPASVK